MKMNSLNRFRISLGIVMLASVGVANAVQVCQSDTAIPATTPASRFTDNGDSTVTDITTRLMWAKCLQGLSGSSCGTGMATTHNWEAALNAANSSTLAGYSDWRLPNVKELRSIVENQCYDPAINLSVFPNSVSGLTWTASPADTSADNNAWLVHFTAGNSLHIFRTYAYNVRLVRDADE